MADTTGSYLIYREDDLLVICEGAPTSEGRVWVLPRHMLDLYLPDMPRPLLVRIPMAGAGGAGVASLNVSVAAGVVLFEWRRRQVEHGPQD